MNLFLHDSKNWTLFSITQSSELFFSTWLKELKLIELSLKELNLLFHDSKNWTFFFEETQWIEYFCDPKNFTFFVECDPKNWTFFVECDPKNWIIVEKHEELILFTKMTENWTLFEPFHMTRRIEHFLIWLKELNLFECDSKNWNFSTKSVQEWIFRMWLKELKFFNMTLTELNISFLEYDAQNWTSLFSNMTHRIEHLFSRIWRTELNISFLEYDAQNWTSLFSNMTHRIFFNMTHRTEHLFLQMTHRTEKKWFFYFDNIFFSKWPKELIFSKVTQRIELIFWKYNPQDWTFSLIWPKERIEILWYDTKDWIFLIWLTEPNTFFNITQRIELFSPTDSKKWTFFSNWLKEVNFFIWQEMTQRFDFFLIWLKEPNTFLNTTQRIEHFFNMTQRIELFSKWLKEVNFIWQNMTQRFDFFCYDSKNRTHFWMWLKELNLFFFKRDSKNWTLFTKGLQELIFSFLIFFNNFFQRFEPFLTWLTELNPFWTVWLIEIEPFFSTWVKENDSFLYDSKIFFFFEKCMTQRMNWSFLENMTLRIEIFERKIYSKNWTFSKIDSMDWTFCFTWQKELNFFSIKLKGLDFF